jgi:deoxycytidine triphosphate deaminase
MILNPKLMLSSGVLTSPNLEVNLDQQLQPNGIDLRVDVIKKVPCNKMSPFMLYKDGKKVAPTHGACEGTLMNSNDAFVLEKGYAYSAECFEMVKIPHGVMGMVYGRSTLMRNGVFCRASVYDSGYHDHVGMMVYPFVDFWVERGTRIAQIIFHSANTAHLYNGQYGVKGENFDEVY